MILHQRHLRMKRTVSAKKFNVLQFSSSSFLLKFHFYHPDSKLKQLKPKNGKSEFEGEFNDFSMLYACVA